MDQYSQQTEQPQTIVNENRPTENKTQMPKLLLPRISSATIKSAVSVAGFILITGSVSLAFYFYNQYKTTQKMLKNPSQVASAETQSLVKKVSLLMDLPPETPQLATVVDKTKLASQPFFAHAQNGDRVLLYTTARKAVLYRPSTNKIIEVAPINVSNSAPQKAAPQQKAQGSVAGTSTKITPTPKK